MPVFGRSANNRADIMLGFGLRRKLRRFIPPCLDQHLGLGSSFRMVSRKLQSYLSPISLVPPAMVRWSHRTGAVSYVDDQASSLTAMPFHHSCCYAAATLASTRPTTSERCDRTSRLRRPSGLPGASDPAWYEKCLTTATHLHETHATAAVA